MFGIQRSQSETREGDFSGLYINQPTHKQPPLWTSHPSTCRLCGDCDLPCASTTAYQNNTRLSTILRFDEKDSRIPSPGDLATCAKFRWEYTILVLCRQIARRRDRRSLSSLLFQRVFPDNLDFNHSRQLHRRHVSSHSGQYLPSLIPRLRSYSLPSVTTSKQHPANPTITLNPLHPQQHHQRLHPAPQRSPHPMRQHPLRPQPQPP